MCQSDRLVIIYLYHLIFDVRGNIKGKRKRQLKSPRSVPLDVINEYYSVLMYEFGCKSYHVWSKFKDSCTYSLNWNKLVYLKFYLFFKSTFLKIENKFEIDILMSTFKSLVKHGKNLSYFFVKYLWIF